MMPDASVHFLRSLFFAFSLSVLLRGREKRSPTLPPARWAEGARPSQPHLTPFGEAHYSPGACFGLG